MMENSNWKPTEEDIRFAWKVWIDENAKLEIVPWLRAYANSIDPKYSVGMSGLAAEILKRCQSAADEIERLQTELADAQVDQRLIEELWERRTDATEMKEQIKLLRKERDDARKQICESHSRNGHQAYQHAIECNWDCYKETP